MSSRASPPSPTEHRQDRRTMPGARSALCHGCARPRGPAMIEIRILCYLRSRDLGGNARRLLLGPGDASSLADYRGALCDRCHNGVSGLFRCDERGIRARQLGGLSGAIAARSVGGLALDSYGPWDGQVLRGLASASAVITVLLW